MLCPCRSNGASFGFSRVTGLPPRSSRGCPFEFVGFSRVLATAVTYLDICRVYNNSVMKIFEDVP